MFPPENDLGGCPFGNSFEFSQDGTVSAMARCPFVHPQSPHGAKTSASVLFFSGNMAIIPHLTRNHHFFLMKIVVFGVCLIFKHTHVRQETCEWKTLKTRSDACSRQLEKAGSSLKKTYRRPCGPHQT